MVAPASCTLSPILRRRSVGHGIVEVGGRDPDDLLLGVHLGARGLFGVARLLQLGLPLGDLLLQLPVAAGLLEQPGLRGQGEGRRRRARRRRSRRPVGTGQREDRHDGKHQRAQGDDAQPG